MKVISVPELTNPLNCLNEIKISAFAAASSSEIPSYSVLFVWLLCPDSDSSEVPSWVDVSSAEAWSDVVLSLDEALSEAPSFSGSPSPCPSFSGFPSPCPSFSGSSSPFSPFSGSSSPSPGSSSSELLWLKPSVVIGSVSYPGITNNSTPSIEITVCSQIKGWLSTFPLIANSIVIIWSKKLKIFPINVTPIG